jgi:NitT/TauT family transport system permease protein
LDIRDAPESRDDDAAISGLDALAGSILPDETKAQRIWFATWPKLAAVALAIFAWQVVVWAHVKPDYLLPGPGTVFGRLWDDAHTMAMWKAIGWTLRRALWGYAIALVLGTVMGLIVSRSRVARSALGSMLTGIQTMPSVAWFPLAILLFKLTEGAITFVIVVGAAPAIANGIISGIDHVPPILVRAGRSLGARRLTMYRRVLLPAAMPGFIAGLKQAWAFAWRSLMAGELITIIANHPSLGGRLDFARTNVDAPELMATMIVILIIGIMIDSVFFARLDKTIRERRGLTAHR